MNRIVTGIIGDGLSSSRHAHTLNILDGFSLLSLASCSPEKGRELGRLHHIPFIDSDPEYLLERDEIDAVVIALPTEKHCSFIRYVTSFSKIAVSESPLSLNQEECEEILRLGEDGEYIFYCNPYLYLPVFDSLSSSYHTFSLEFSSISMMREETVQIALEVLIRAFGSIADISTADDCGRYSLRLERGEGTMMCSYDSDLNGLSLTVDGLRIIPSVQYYDALPDFYSFLYSRLENGGDIERPLRTAVAAARAREKILPLGNISI